MPSALCGIEGVGMKTAEKMCDNDEQFGVTIAKQYKKKYGLAGLARASLTYQMVRLLTMKDLEGGSYANDLAIEELRSVVVNVPKLIVPIEDQVAALFAKNNPKPEDLFK